MGIMALYKLCHQREVFSFNMVCKVAITLIIILHFMIQLEIGSSVASAHTHKGHRKHAVKQRKSHNHKETDEPRMRSDSYSSYSTNIFDVLSYGAVGDGETDDTQAFMGAWQEACQVEGAIFEVPEYFTFVVRPLTFSGPCASNILFQIQGNIVAASTNKWGPSRNVLQWINFSKLHNMQVQGPGLVDGKGAAWWPTAKRNAIRPTAIRFYGGYNVTVKNLKIVNSPQTHLKFDSCAGVKVSNISIHSPPSSPNTDGIHLQNTQDVEIFDSYIENGDDCISIQTGSSNLDIHDLICEAGHGISLGALGRGQTQACVSNVTVHDVFIRNSQNGVRIKTWQGGFGAVKAITYRNVYVVNISNPIIIDQFYCDASKCKNQSSAVQVSEVAYHNIKGTYSRSSPVHFACSDTMPCTSISVTKVELLPQGSYFLNNPFCWNIYGTSLSPTIPPLHCLQSGLPPSSTTKGLKKSSIVDVC